MKGPQHWALVSIAAGLAWVASGSAAQRSAGLPAAPTISKAAPVPQTGTAAISGAVVDGTTDHPVLGAIVWINISSGVALSGPTRLVSDSRGRFVFARLPAGNYALSASKFGYITSRFGQADPTIGSLHTIRLDAGQWFADARVVIWRPSAITGTITDEAGEPVVGSFVRVLTQVMVSGRPQMAAGLVAKTDDRGRYRVAGLPRGRYAVMVPSVQASVPGETTLADLAGYTADMIKAAELAGRPIALPDDPAVVIDARNRLMVGGYVTPPASAGAWTYPPTFFPSGRTINDAALIDLDYGAERSGIDIRLAPVRSVRVSGVVQGPAEAAPAGMTLRLLPNGSEALGTGSETATALVASTGSFTLLNVPSGDYTLIASRSTMEYTAGSSTSLYSMPAPPGWGPSDGGFGGIGSGSQGARYFLQQARGSTEYSARVTLTVGEQDLSGLVVSLRRAATLSGRIVPEADQTPSAAPASGRTVFTIHAEPANGDVSLGMPSGSTIPGDATRFRVDGLLAGGYTLRLVGSGGGAVKSIEWQGRDYTDQPFDASSGQNIEDVVITLTTRLGTLTGSVRDAKGQPAADGAVIIFPANPSLWSGYGFRSSRILSALTLADGAFTLSQLPGGDYFVVAVDGALAKAWQNPKFLETAVPLASKIAIGWGDLKKIDLTISAIKGVR